MNRKRLERVLRRAAKAGAITKLPQADGTVKYKIAEMPMLEELWPKGKASGRPGDRRTLPKIGAKPVRPDNLIRWLAHDIAKQNGVVTEDQVAKAFGKVRVLNVRKKA